MVDKEWLAEGLGDTGMHEDAENSKDAEDPEGAWNSGNVENFGIAENADNTEEPDDRYRKLPERIRVEDMIATKETRPVPDPKMGRDTETDFMLRNAGGFG